MKSKAKTGVRRIDTETKTTAYKRTVTDAVSLLCVENNCTKRDLRRLSEFGETDFEGGLTVTGINRCLDEDEVEVITHTLTHHDLKEFNGELRVRFPNGNGAQYPSVDNYEDDVDVYRVVV